MRLNCLYTIYLMSCFNDVAGLFGLDRDTALMAILVGDGALGTRTTLYEPAREMFLTMPFVNKRISYDDNQESILKLDNGIILAPQLAGSDQWKKAMAIFYAGLDESNRLPVVRRSACAEDGEQIYDQARVNYDLTINRAESRYGRKSFNLWKVFIAGSARRKDSMIEGLITDLDKSESKNHRVYRNRQYDIRPKKAFSKDTFCFCLSTEKYRAHVIDKGEVRPDMWVMDDVPMNYYANAKMNPSIVQRDVLGYPTDAIDSYISDNQAITDAFNGKVKSIVNIENITLGRNDDPDTYFTINEDNLPSLNFRKKTPHWIHVDLSKSSCSTGISMCFISDIENMGGSLQARYQVPLCASIIPGNNLEIRADKVRAFIKMLRDTYHYNIAGVSFDSYNSIESIQQLTDAGFNTVEISTVRTIKPYEDLKMAILSKRIQIAENEVAEKECKQLESETMGERETVICPATGCFTGDTRVALADGTCPSFEELLERDKQGEELFVYSIDNEGMSIQSACSPRVTKYTDELVEVMLDNFQVIRCTPEHRFMTLNGDWIQAQNITPEISLMPLYRSITHKGAKNGGIDYERVWCPVREERFYTHRLAKGLPTSEYVVHHLDHNKTNNNPTNLEIMSPRDHHLYHINESWERKEDKMRLGYQEHLNNGGGTVHSERMKALWDSGKFRPRKKECLIDGCEVLANARGLCGAHYQKARREKTLPYRYAKQKNHKALHVKRLKLKEPVPVYDLSVPATQNFALAAGVVVHNSKDIADTLAGCTTFANQSVYFAQLRLEFQRTKISSFKYIE